MNTVELSSFWPRFRERVRHYLKPTWVMDGRCRISGNPARLIYRGLETNKNYVVAQLFDDVSGSQYCGKRWVHPAKMAGACQLYRADLLINEVEYDRLSAGLRETGLYIPCWISGELDLTAEDAIDKHKVRDDLRKIRKNRLHYEISRCIDDFNYFYTTMYVPFVSGAHADKTVLRSHSNVVGEVENRELFKITMEGEWVAGGVIVYTDKGPKGTALGVKHASPDYLKAGVIAAVYHYQREYLLERGYTQFDYGASRAFVNDGLLRYKLKWGVRLSTPDRSVLHVVAGTDRSLLTRFLSHNPTVMLDNGVLKVVGVIDPGWFDEQHPLEAVRRITP